MVRDQFMHHTTSASERLPSWFCRYLKDSGLKQIEQAVSVAEQSTSGEIIPILVRSSVSQQLVRWLIALWWIIAVLVVLPILPMAFTSQQYLILEFLAISVGLLVVWTMPLPPIFFRMLVPPREVLRQVEARAELEFYRCRTQETAGKTGILLFVSLYERQAVVLADRGISSILPPSTWDDLLAMMLDGLKNHDAAAGYTNAIKKCGEILSMHFPLESGDQNELQNKLVIKE